VSSSIIRCGLSASSDRFISATWSSELVNSVNYDQSVNIAAPASPPVKDWQPPAVIDTSLASVEWPGRASFNCKFAAARLWPKIGEAQRRMTDQHGTRPPTSLPVKRPCDRDTVTTSTSPAHHTTLPQLLIA